MRAVVLTKTCKADELEIIDVPIPSVKPDWVLVKIKAFGLNHSEVILRQYEADAPYIKLPLIPGIECVGEIAEASNSHFKVGQRVCALMGGMGRDFDGSYAEYCLIPVKHVFSVDSDLPWNEMAAIPEIWFTAWGSLFECLQLNSQDTLLIHGGTSALGIAAIQIAKNIGCNILATTRQTEKLPFLASCGAVPLIDNERLSDQILENGFDLMSKVFELVGQTAMDGYSDHIQKHGIICCSGNLGNAGRNSNFDIIKAIPNGVYLSSFYSNFPTQKIVDDIFKFIKEQKIRPILGGVFRLDEIRIVHQMLENGSVTGKLVVTMT